MNKKLELKSKAQHEIGRILKDLELSTNSIVEKIGISCKDFTSYDSVGVEIGKQVEIKMTDSPGSNWL